VNDELPDLACIDKSLPMILYSLKFVGMLVLQVISKSFKSMVAVLGPPGEIDIDFPRTRFAKPRQDLWQEVGAR